MLTRNVIVVAATLVVVLAIGASMPSALAQVLYGSLVGNVLDPSKGAVPRASVTATNMDTGLVREVSTDERGFYAFRALQGGSYTLRITASGFTPFERTSIPVTINTTVRIDAQLKLGGVIESVTVSAEAEALLQADKADVHTELGIREVTNLPMTGYRNYQSLIDLVPGATPAQFQNAQIDTPARSLTTNINGTSRNSNTTRIDGATSVFPYMPHHTLYVPPAESIETVNITTSSFDAEQGMAGGAAISVTTKSGTNELHGVGFEYHNNNTMAARNFFYLNPRRPKNIQNQYGGTLGGPILKNKLFFFGSFEGMRQRQNYSATPTVATADQRDGNFSATGVVLYDPQTGTPDGKNRAIFSSAQIPLSRQSTISRKMQSYVPSANLSGYTNNYFAAAPVVFDRDNMDYKVNWNKSERTMAWGKYSMMEGTVIGQPSLGAGGGVGLLTGGGMGTGHTLVQVAGIGFTHTFSPSLVMDSNMGYSRLGQNVKGPDYGKNFGLDVLGIPGTNGPDIRQSGQPIFSVTGYESMGNSENWSPIFRNDNVFTYSANTGWTKGAHNVRFGADIGRVHQNDFQPQRGRGPRGGFVFTGGITALNGGAAPKQFNAYADFLLGLPQTAGKSWQYLCPMSTREWSHGYYFRDQWQALRNLTITLGLRWEYYPLMTRAHSGIERYDPDTNKVLLGGVGSVPDNAGTTVSKTHFAPRVGLAYRLGAKTVFRAGYGISIDPYPMARAMRDPYPVVVALEYTSVNSYTPARRLEDGIPLLEPIDVGDGTIPIDGDFYTKTLPKGPLARGYVGSLNVMVQRELPLGFTGQAGYVGTRSIRQGLFYELNAGLVPGAGAAGQPLNVAFGRKASTQEYRSFRTGNYNGLQAKLERRFSGLTMTMAYTYSKAIDWVDNNDGYLSFQIPFAMNRNRAAAGFDRTHVLQMSAVAELPFGAGKRWLNTVGVAKALAGGWQLNTVVSSYTGTPFTVGAAATSLNAAKSNQVADQVLASVEYLGGIGTGHPFFDPKAFRAVTEPRFGNSGRNTLRGPGLVNLNLGLFRTFDLTERFKLQFRAESFNFCNTPHFNNPNSTVTSNSFTFITTAADDQRLFRVALRVSF